VLADLMIVAYDLGLVGLDDGQHASTNAGTAVFCVLPGPVIEFALAEHVARVGNVAPTAVFEPRFQPT